MPESKKPFKLGGTISSTDTERPVSLASSMAPSRHGRMFFECNSDPSSMLPNVSVLMPRKMDASISMPRTVKSISNCSLIVGPFGATTIALDLDDAFISASISKTMYK